MLDRRHVSWALIAASALLAAPAARAAVRLSSLFSDHAVLQQKTPVPVWGWADAEEKVTVSIAGQEKSAVAGPVRRGCGSMLMA